MAAAASSATPQAQIAHSPYRTYGVSPVVAVTVASSSVRSKSLVCWCTTPLASMTAEIPEIAACTRGRPVSAARICPIATCWAEFAERS